MKVFVPNGNHVAKIVGASLLSMVVSLTGHAADARQGHGQSQSQTGVQVGKIKGSDQSQTVAQSKTCTTSQTSAQTKDCGQSSAQTKDCAPAQTKDCGQSSAQAKDCGKAADCCSPAPAPAPTCSTHVGATVTKESCNKGDAFQSMGPKTQVFSSYTKGYQADFGDRNENWDGAAWGNSYFENLDFHRIMSREMTISNVYINGNFRHWHLDRSNIKNSTFSGTLEDVDFSKATLTNVKFEGAQLQRRHLSRCNFDEATLNHVHFVNSSLKDVTFKNAHLMNVVIDRTSIENANIFRDAYLWNGTTYIQVDRKTQKYIEQQLDRTTNETINTNDWLKGFTH